MIITDFNGNIYLIKHISMIGEIKQDICETGKYYFDFDCGGVTHTISDYDHAIILDFRDKMIKLVSECVNSTHTMKV